MNSCPKLPRPWHQPAPVSGRIPADADPGHILSSLSPRGVLVLAGQGGPVAGLVFFGVLFIGALIHVCQPLIEKGKRSGLKGLTP